MCLFRNLWHSERKNHPLKITKFLRNKSLQGGIWIGGALRGIYDSFLPPLICPEMQAVMKMADLTKFRQTKETFEDLTILVNFSQIHQSEISLVELVILTNFRHLRYRMHFWTYPKGYDL